MCTSKFGVILTNAILFVISLVMIIAGAVTQNYLTINYRLIIGSISTPASFTIVFGSLLLLTAMLALISIFCRNYILLSIYIYTLGFLLIIQLGIGIAGFVMKSLMLRMIVDALLSAEPRYLSDSLANSTWNAVQRDLLCCGLHRHDEWFYYFGNSSLPDSCCIHYTPGCGEVAVKTGNVFETDCASAINVCAKKYEIQFAILLPIMLTLEFVSLVCARRHVRVLNIFNTFEDHNYRWISDNAVRLTWESTVVAQNETLFTCILISKNQNDLVNLSG